MKKSTRNSLNAKYSLDQKSILDRYSDQGDLFYRRMVRFSDALTMVYSEHHLVTGRTLIQTTI